MTSKKRSSVPCALRWRVVAKNTIIIGGSLPWDRFLAPTSSTSPYPQLSSSSSHIHHSFLCFLYSDYSLNHFYYPFSYQMLLLDNLSFLSLVYLAVASPSLSPPSRLLINLPFSTHVLSNFSVFDLLF